MCTKLTTFDIKKYKTLPRFITKYYNGTNLRNDKDGVQRRGQLDLGILIAYMTHVLYRSKWLQDNDYAGTWCCHIAFNCVFSAKIMYPLKFTKEHFHLSGTGIVWWSPQAQTSVQHCHVTFNINCISMKILSQLNFMKEHFILMLIKQA
jgi:hypothetical protein